MRSAVAAKQGIWGARCEAFPQAQAPRGGLKEAGRLGKHQPTQPVAEDAGADTEAFVEATARGHGFG